jgi:hypothetical protein
MRSEVVILYNYILFSLKIMSKEVLTPDSAQWKEEAYCAKISCCWSIIGAVVGAGLMFAPNMKWETQEYWSIE